MGTSCGVKEVEPTDSSGKESSCVQAVVGWCGPTDFTKQDNQQTASNAMKHAGGPSAESGFLGCDLAQCSPDLIRLASPIGLVPASSPPFLIMQGDSDALVPWKQSQELFDALKSNGVWAQFKLLPGLNHIFAGATDLQAWEILKTVYGFLDPLFM